MRDRKISSHWLVICSSKSAERIHRSSDPEAFEALRSYSWPGNVRQLKNCLERAVILSNNGRITVSELPPEVGRPGAHPVAFVPMPASVAIADMGATGSASPASLRDMERQQILSALETNRMAPWENCRDPRNFSLYSLSSPARLRSRKATLTVERRVVVQVTETEKKRARH